MRRLTKSLLAASLVACSFGIGETFAEARTRVVVQVRPPAPRVEVRVARPHAHAVWIGGAWTWSSGRYVWRSGRWISPPQRHAVWVPGHWTRHHGGWVWVEGRWR